MADYIYPFGDAPDDAEFVLGEANEDLPNGLVLLPGPGISITQGSGTITVTNTGGGDTTEQSYWTADDETATLPNSFKVEAGNNISIDYTAGTVTISASGGSGGGSVNSFGANNGAPLFNTSVTNPTTDPVLSFNMTSNVINALATGLTGTGYVTQNGNTFTDRTLTGSSNISVTNGTGTGGDPVWDVTNRVFTVATSALLNALSSSTSGGTGGVYQLSDTAFINRTLTGTANRITIGNPVGLAGNPTFDVGSDVYTISSSNVLNDLATSTSTGIVVQSDAIGHHVYRSIAGTAGEINVTNPTGVGANPTLSLDSSVYTERDSSLLNYLASSAPNLGEVPLGTTDGHFLNTKPNAGTGVQLDFGNGVFTISATGATGNPGTLTNFTAGQASPVFGTSVANPTSAPALTFNITSNTLTDLATSSGTGIVVSTDGIHHAYRQVAGTTGEINVTNPAGTAGNITLALDSSVYTDRDSSVLNALATGLTGTGFVSQNGAQFYDRTLTGTSNRLTITNPTGAAGDPVFDVGTDVLVVGDVTALPGIQIVNGSGTIQVGASGALGGTLTDFIIGDANPLFSTDATNTTSVPNVSFTLGQAASATFWRGSASGAPSTAFFGGILGTDLTGALEAGSNITITQAAEPGSRLIIASSGSTGYSTVEEEGTPLTQRSTINFVGAGITAADVSSKTQVSLDDTLNALATFSATGIMVSQGSDTFVGREIIGTPNQVTVAQGNGIPGNITLGLDSGINANLIADGSVSSTEFQYLDGASSNIQAQIDQKQPLSGTLNALASSLSGTGYVIQTGPNAFVERDLATANSNHISITNPSGVAGASTFDIGSEVFTVSTSNVLNDLASSTSTGIVVQSDAVGHHVYRSIATANTNHITVANPTGVGADPTLDIGPNVYTNENYSLLNYLATSAPTLGEIPMGTTDNHYLLTKPNAGTGVQLDFANGVFTISATGAGSSGYNLIQEEGTPLTQRTTINFVGDAITASDSGGVTQVAPHTSVNSIAVTPTNGQVPIGNGTNFTVAAPFAGPGIQIDLGAGTLQISASGAANALITAGDLSPLFTTTESANNLSFTQSVAASGTYFGVVKDGASATPSFLTLVPGALSENNIDCGLFIDGASAVISSGEVGVLPVDFNGTVVGWTVLSLQSATTVLNVYKSTYANYPSMTSMVGAGTKPGTSTAYKNKGGTADWGVTTISNGDILRFVVESNDLSQGIGIALKILRTS